MNFSSVNLSFPPSIPRVRVSFSPTQMKSYFCRCLHHSAQAGPGVHPWWWPSFIWDKLKDLGCFLNCVDSCKDVLVVAAVQLLSPVQLSATPWTTERQASLFFTISQSLLKLMSIESMMPSNHHTLCHPLLLLPSTFPSIRVFSNELSLHIRWPKYWSFSSSISPSSEYQGWFPLGWTSWISLQSKGLSGTFSNPTVQKYMLGSGSNPWEPTRSALHQFWVLGLTLASECQTMFNSGICLNWCLSIYSCMICPRG